MAIRLLKFYDRQSLARPLARMMAEFAEREMDCRQYDYLIPVPLHRVRQRERGYNQSKLIAANLLDAFPGAALDESLRRIRPTRVQSLSSTTAERRANVRGAFAVSGEHLRDKAVLLVDDVVTTGGTTAECARALKRAGAAVVDVMAAALAAKASGS
jgi:ComF family protein